MSSYFASNGSSDPGVDLVSNNKVGIGMSSTATPGARLHIKDTECTLLIEATGANSSAKLELKNYTRKWILNSDASPDLFSIDMYNGSSTVQLLALTQGGNLGVGVTSPVNKLDVEGAAVIGSAYSGTNSAPSNGLLVEGAMGVGTATPHVNTLLQVRNQSNRFMAHSTNGYITIGFASSPCCVNPLTCDLDNPNAFMDLRSTISSPVVFNLNSAGNSNLQLSWSDSENNFKLNKGIQISGKVKATNGTNAALNIPVLDNNPGTPSSGDVWLLNRSGYFLKAYINSGIRSVTLT